MSAGTPRIAILGATGYGGGELLRLLLGAGVKIVHATSRSKAGTPVGRVHRNLTHLTDLKFGDPSNDELVQGADIIFGALPHASAAETLAPLHDAGKIVIDLSGDFRLRDAAVYTKWYKHDHPRADLLAQAVYGCPEWNADKIRGARLVASPGCFATSINLALLPAAAAGLIEGTPTVVALTGSSGSGAEAKEGTHHPTRAQTLRPYKVLDHQHVPECVQLAREAGSAIDFINFTPVSAPIVRGILAVVTADLKRAMSTKEAEELFREFYAKRGRFVKIVTDRDPECHSVAGTNYAEVRPRVTPDGKLHVVTALDNLVKGGAGQAVECLSLMRPDISIPGLDWPGMWP